MHAFNPADAGYLFEAITRIYRDSQPPSGHLATPHDASVIARIWSTSEEFATLLQRHLNNHGDWIADAYSELARTDQTSIAYTLFHHAVLAGETLLPILVAYARLHQWPLKAQVLMPVKIVL